MGNNFDEVVMSANVEDLRTCVVCPVCEGEECGWNVLGWSVPRAMRHTIKPALACRLHITPHSNIGAVHTLTGIGGELEHVQFPVMEHTNGDPVA